MASPTSKMTDDELGKHFAAKGKAFLVVHTTASHGSMRAWGAAYNLTVDDISKWGTRSQKPALVKLRRIAERSDIGAIELLVGIGFLTPAEATDAIAVTPEEATAIETVLRSLRAGNAVAMTDSQAAAASGAIRAARGEGTQSTPVPERRTRKRRQTDK